MKMSLPHHRANDKPEPIIRKECTLGLTCITVVFDGHEIRRTGLTAPSFVVYQ